MLTEILPEAAEIGVTDKTDRIERLRKIIEKQENRDVSYQEALDIGYKLLRFYETLGGID
jgi:hypothetical protein